MQQFTTWFSKQKTIGKLATGCGGLFLLLCLCSIPMAIFSPSTPAPEEADVSSIQTAAFETAVAGVNQTAIVNAPAEAVETSTPIPANTPIYSPMDKNYPAPRPSLYDEILSKKDSMTDLQWKDYLGTLTGERINLKGTVNEVHEDGEIYLTAQGGGFFDSVYLRGVPKEIAITLNKGQVMEFDASIREFTDFIVFSVTLDEPVIYIIK